MNGIIIGSVSIIIIVIIATIIRFKEKVRLVLEKENTIADTKHVLDYLFLVWQSGTGCV